MDAIEGKARVRDTEWEDCKHEILDLYLGHELTLNELKQRMKGRLDASTSQFEAQLKAWNARKNLKGYEWERVFDEMDKLPSGTRSQVAISGYKVSDRKLQRARQARKRRARELRRPQHGSEHGETLNIQLPEGVSIEILPPTRNLSSLTLPSAAELVRTHIDSGGSFDDSLSPVSNASDHTQNPIETISLANGGDPGLREEQHRALSHRSTNTAYQSRMRLSPDSHPSNRVAAALMLQNLGVIENAHLLQATPPAWLNTLPSILFEDRIYPSLPSDSTTLTGPGDIISVATSAQNRWIQLFRDVMPLEDAPASHSSGPWPVSLVHTVRSFLQGGSFKISDNLNGAITSTDEILIRLIIQSIMNGFSGLEDIPVDRIVRLLGRFQNLILVLVQVLKGNRNRAAQSLAENLFRAAVDANEPRLLGQLLETNLIGLNEGYFPYARTLIRHAIRCNNLEVIKLMIRHGAYVDTGPQDTLDTFLSTIGSVSGIITGWEDIFHALLDAGAKVDLEIISQMKSGSLTADMVSLLLGHVSPVYHEKVIETCLVYIADHFDDSRATEEVCNMIRTCELFHDGKCVLKFPKEIAKALIVSAGRGKCSLVKLLLPYLAHDSRYYRGILVASIMSCDDGLINLILEKMPDVRPRFYVRYREPRSASRMFRRASTPLEAAILTQDGQLIRRFEEAGALLYFDDHPQDQDSLGILLSAACRVGNMGYAQKLLAAISPLRPSQGLTEALIYAMFKGEQSIVFELLHTAIPEIGQGMVNVDINGTTERYTPLTAAIALKNREYVRAILNESVEGEGSPRNFAEVIKWGDESIITDFLSVHPNLKNFAQSPNRTRIRRDTFHILTEINSDTLDFLIDSATTTRVALNNYLECAIRNHSSETIQKLLDRGADPSKVLKMAAQEYPSALGVLLNQIVEGIKPVVNDSGMPALVAAIEGGPESIKVLDALLRTELFDLKRKGLLFVFDNPFPNLAPQPSHLYKLYYPAPHSQPHNYISPLGLAIKNEKNHDPDLLIINRLLIAGCDVNSMAYRGYQTRRTALTRRIGGIICETALLMAIPTNNERLVRLLIDHGADVNSKTVLTLRQTPLQCAAQVGNFTIVRILLEHGAEINAEPAARSGGTAIQFAAIGGSCIVAAELLRLGANLRAAPSKRDGRWPLEGAAENGRLDMIDFLWKANENLKAMGPLPKTTGFEPEQCLSAMRLARENNYLACEGLIADLSGQSPCARDAPEGNDFTKTHKKAHRKTHKPRRHATKYSSSDSDSSDLDSQDSDTSDSDASEYDE